MLLPPCSYAQTPKDEKFKLSFKFDSKYPTEPPEVTFVAKVPGK